MTFKGDAPQGRARLGTPAALLAVAWLVATTPAFAAQSWRGKNLYFGDMHWHSCLSQDGHTPLTAQYRSMLYDFNLDFSFESDHAEGAEAGIIACDTYMPPRVIGQSNGFPIYDYYSGEEIASTMKQAADQWNGSQFLTDTQGIIKFVAFPGYEWAPDARCWDARATNLSPNDRNGDDTTPGHINYFFSDTAGWTYHNDVWAPGNGDSDICLAVSELGFAYYNGSKDWVDEILGQLIHQRDDPDRPYDLMIQYNHPAASIDKGGDSDHFAKWYDFEHCDSSLEDPLCARYCSVADGGPACTERHCEALRRAYGVTSVEWYTNQEAGLGSTEIHPYGETDEHCAHSILTPPICAALEQFHHDAYHVPERFVMSRGLREGYMLAAVGGSDSHSGRRFAPTSLTSRGAGSRSLTVAYAAESTRPAIWDAVSRRHTYALSRAREIGPVHKGRVDFFTPQPSSGREFVMGDLVEATATGTPRDFTISAGSETATTGVYPVELRLYRVSPNTPLSTRTDVPFAWLDGVQNDPGKLGELLGTFPNSSGSPTLTHTFTNVVVYPGDAVFAIVPYSDYVYVDEFFASDGSPLDEDENHEPDPGKTPMLSNNDNTWARTTPIFFHATDEQPIVSPVCAHVGFAGSGSASDIAAGGVDAGLSTDKAVLPVATNGYPLEWNRWRFSLASDTQYVDLSFWNRKDGDGKGHLFAVRIDGQLVYSGRAGIDHAADTLVDLEDIPFPLAAGLHQLEIHMDDQARADGNNDPDFHCNDYDGPPGFLDAIAFHADVDAVCGDVTPPQITCPSNLALECSTTGGVPATDSKVVAFLKGATATDDIDTTPTITHDAPTFFPNGTTTVTFTATDDSKNAATCTASVVVSDSRPPQLAAFNLSPTKLTPPNHNLVTITVPTLVATDVCDASPKIRCTVSSSEAANGLGDGDQPIDIVFNGEKIVTSSTGERQLTTTAGRGTFTLQLRAERSATVKTGRTYTTSCVGVDASSNRSAARTATVTAPK